MKDIEDLLPEEVDSPLVNGELNGDGLVGERAGFHIVGIGASAGGLEALEVFFEEVPADCDMAFVVIQHLSPDFKSVMDQLLSRHTSLAVHRVEDGMEVRPGAIYLIPPKKEMIISDGRLLLSDKDPLSGLTLPIDTFFRSLAQDAGERAIAIILSGTGSDGSRGIREVHEAGGLVLTQTIESAKFDGMPKSAIDTGIVDLQLSPEEMPAAIVRYAQHEISSEPGAVAGADGLATILGLLRREYGIDFSHYKDSTLHRRIERRVTISHSSGIDDFAKMLTEEPQELHLLYKDLLIGVTRFFRDAEAFRALELRLKTDVLPRLSAGEELRIWSAACATGEEAYSLAILLNELIEAEKRPIEFKIFATDVHSSLLEMGASGEYIEAALEGIDPAYLKRYFVQIEGGYRVVRDLREKIVFAPHNLLKDAPFTKLDLISCRNILIYLQPPAQRKVLSLFHFGLKTQGILFLGQSESPGELADEFEAIEPRHKVFRKSRDVRLPTDPSLNVTSPLSVRRQSRQNSADELPERQRLDIAREALVTEFAPPTLLVDHHARLIHSFCGGGRFLSLEDGKSSLCVLDLVPTDLKVVLNGALQRASKERKRVDYVGVPFRSPDGPVELRVTVMPVSSDEEGNRRYLISLQPHSRMISLDQPEMIDMGDESRERIHRLEEELQYTRENLQATLEEMETANEELQATNEELVASNEELQSTNEELQSVNEELYTVNSEYQRKIAELTQLNADMDNLFASTDVGVIFVDRELRIRKFTPQIADTFHLADGDVGRRLESFAHTLNDEFLLDDVKRVSETGEPIEREVQDRNGVFYLLRIFLYRGALGHAEGVVLSLIDVSSLKEAQKRLQRMSRVFQDGADPIIIEDARGIITDINDATLEEYGYARDELVGQPIAMLIPDDLRELSITLREQCFQGENVRNVETFRVTKSGERIPVLLTFSLLADEESDSFGIATVAKEISRLKQAEAAAQESVRRRDEFLAMLSHELRNPLGGILNAVRVMKHEAASPEQVTRAAEAVERQSLHMSRLLNDLLDVTRVTCGKIDFRKTVLDLRELVNDSLQAVQLAFEEKRQEFTVTVPEEPVVIEGDPARLLQIMENLLTNASKYTSVGGQIDFELRKQDETCEIRVKDNGRGIEPAIQQGIFDLFVQADRTLDRRDGGMGVGLTLVRSLVELHDGRISVNSKGRDCGSEFIVELPLSKQPVTANLLPEVHTEQPLNRLSIVIVEDDPLARAMLQELLSLDGHRVESAEDGERGLAKIRENQPDVALVDIGLPRLDGYEIARQLRADATHQGIRLVALTGYGRQQDREAVKQAGFDDHLVKPLDPNALEKVLQLGTKRQAQA